MFWVLPSVLSWPCTAAGAAWGGCLCIVISACAPPLQQQLLARGALLFLAPHLHFTSLIRWFTASRQKMNSLHFVLLNQSRMGKTALIIFYSNPTYLNHLLLSPVSRDMSAISYLCGASAQHQGFAYSWLQHCLIPKLGEAPSSSTWPHGSNSETELIGLFSHCFILLLLFYNALFCHRSHVWNRACELGWAQPDISVWASHEVYSRFSRHSSVVHRAGAASVGEGEKCSRHWSSGHFTR